PSLDDNSESGPAFRFHRLPEPKRVGAIYRTFVDERSYNGTHKLTLNCVRKNSDLVLRVTYDESRFTHSDIQRILSHFSVLLQRALSSPELAVGTLPLLSEAERQKILAEWNDTEAAYPTCCLHDLFEQQALRVPDRQAVRCGEAVLSYRELNDRANRLAHY